MTGLEGKLKKARALGSEGRYHESLDILKALHKEQSENVQVLFLAGASFFKLGDFEKARTAWEKVLSVDPGHAKAKEWLAKVPGGLAAESVPADSPSQPGGGRAWTLIPGSRAARSSGLSNSRSTVRSLWAMSGLWGSKTIGGSVFLQLVSPRRISTDIRAI
jgi:hypothetical protein